MMLILPNYFFFHQGKDFQQGVLLIEMRNHKNIHHLFVRVEKQDLETVTWEIQGGISWTRVCLESLGPITSSNGDLLVY